MELIQCKPFKYAPLNPISQLRQKTDVFIAYGAQIPNQAAPSIWHGIAVSVLAKSISLQNDPDKIGGVARTEFFHDAGTMHFDGAWRYPQIAPGLLV